MDFFTTKYTKHISRQSESRLSNKDIYSKLFIYKHPSLNQVSPIIARQLSINQTVIESSTSPIDASTQYSISPSINLKKKKFNSNEHLAPKLMTKKSKPVNVKCLNVKPKIETEKFPKKRRKIHSFSRKNDLNDSLSCKTRQRRNFSTDHKNLNSEKTKLEDLKDYLKSFHKRSKLLLSELKTNVLGK